MKIIFIGKKGHCAECQKAIYDNQSFLFCPNCQRMWHKNCLNDDNHYSLKELCICLDCSSENDYDLVDNYDGKS